MVQHIIQAYILLITRIYLAPAGLGKSTQLATYPGASYAKQSNKVYISVIFQPLNASPLIILDPTRAFLLEPPKGRMLETLGEREFQAAARNELTLQLRNIQSLETFVYCLLFIVLFAISFTKQKKSTYLNSHGEEAQEKPPGLQGMGSLSQIIRTKYCHNYTWENQWQSYSKS